jgi:hypothetical protein
MLDIRPFEARGRTTRRAIQFLSNRAGSLAYWLSTQSGLMRSSGQSKAGSRCPASPVFDSTLPQFISRMEPNGPEATGGPITARLGSTSISRAKNSTPIARRHPNENPLFGDLFAFLMLSAMGATAQDYVCAIFETEEIACNDAPYRACSSRAVLSGVILGGGTDFGCNHPVTQPLTCPGGSSCPTNHISTCFGVQPLLRADLTE